MSKGEGAPLIIYVPGLKPKPEPAAHRRELCRCLIEGIQRIDPESAAQMAAREDCFDIIGWTYDFYGETRDINLDLDAINALIHQQSASELDRAEAGSWKRKFLRWLYTVADHFPFLMHPFADEKLEHHLRDLRRYVKNRRGVAEDVRRQLKTPLRAAWELGRPILLIGHSMGSIIAYDSLWQLSRESGSDRKVDLFITMGSPLAQKFIQRRIMGRKEEADHRYPGTIRHWVNIAAVGDLTAIDMKLQNDYGDMVKLGLTESIDDKVIYNYFRLDGVLNVHAEYGYLINEVTAGIVSKWWRSVTPDRGSA